MPDYMSPEEVAEEKKGARWRERRSCSCCGCCGLCVAVVVVMVIVAAASSFWWCLENISFDGPKRWFIKLLALQKLRNTRGLFLFGVCPKTGPTPSNVHELKLAEGCTILATSRLMPGHHQTT